MKTGSYENEIGIKGMYVTGIYLLSRFFVWLLFGKNKFLRQRGTSFYVIYAILNWQKFFLNNWRMSVQA